MTNPLCARWKALLQDTGNRGKIYSDFIRDKKALSKHFWGCKACGNIVLEIDPEIEMLQDIPTTDEKFGKIIREFWRLSRQKSQAP